MISDLFLQPLLKSRGYRDLAAAIDRSRGKPAAAFGLSEGAKTVVAGALSTGRRTLVVTPSEQSALRMAEDLTRIGVPALYFPARDMTLYHMAAESRELIQRRIAVLGRLLRGEAQVVAAPVEALLTPLMPRQDFAAALLRIEPGDELDLDRIARLLTDMGYERQDLVEGRGQFAVRGGILDVYPVQALTAYRVELFGDEVDSVRELDVMTQRSSPADDPCEVYPATEAVAGLAQMQRAAALLAAELSGLASRPAPAKKPDEPDLPWLTAEEDDGAVVQRADTSGRRQEIIDSLHLGHRTEALENFIPYLYENTAYFSDYFDPELVVLDEYARVKERAQNMGLEFAARLESALERGEGFPGQQRLMEGWESIPRMLEKRCCAILGMLQVGLADVRLSALCTLESRQTPDLQGQNALLIEQLELYRGKGLSVAMLSGGHARGERLAETLRERGLSVTFTEEPAALAPGQMAVLPIGLTRGFELPEAGFAVLGDQDLFGTTRQRAARRRHKAGQKIQAFTDLKVGDYVVHESHGIGVYTGTVRMTMEGKTRDYLHIQYQGSDALYVPTDQLDRVQKYIGMENKVPKLNRLGGSEWQRSKSRVKHEIMEMADELIKLYAARQATPGFAFSPDTPWQRDFEDDFPYEETPDQLQCIAEIKADMQQPHPMDRLLCGDVGYGKTEVAVRAAFKAVMDSKQVAFLVPTTVLAQQHFQSIKKRFQHFPVRIEMLSRFRTPQEQKHILEQLREGKIDILIGTHRLLGKDVRFKDLGLVVIDEEQRFGVAHKEKLKQLKNQVDVLTLSATPIPRTLHMSMVGIRDMSLLETPPEERYPVQTYVLEYSDALIRDAILRELQRKGQVYLLYNRVRSIERFYDHICRLVPEARVAIGHGQMRENSLEDVMLDFYEGKFDVLVCSTIIESGLDVPTANTMIVCDADRFGLSQLYQLRGRVGRSNRLAYCYLTVPPNKVLTEVAEKRLSAIREFTEFGSGFKIAMRDLEIRGAGNLLGSQQHGQLSDVGYDLYCKLMEEAVNELRGQAGLATDIETKVELRVDAYLPMEFVQGDTVRMEVYKRIASIESRDDWRDVMDELIDRFGDVPPEAEHLLWIALLKSLASRLGVEMVLMRAGRLTLRFSPYARVDGARLVKALNRAGKTRLTLQQAGTATLLVLDRKGEPEQLMELAVDALEQLLAQMEQN